MAEKFVGKWKLVESVGLDDYLKAIGIGLMTRTMASKLKPVLVFEVNGTHWKFTSVSTFKTHVTEFFLDTEFEEETPDGRKMRSVFTFDGNQLVQVQKKISPKDRDSRFVRYIDAEGRLVIICESCGVKCIRRYQRAN